MAWPGRAGAPTLVGGAASGTARSGGPYRAFRALCQHVVGRSGLARGDEHGLLALAIIRDLAARLREMGFLPLEGGSWLDDPDAGAAPLRAPDR